MFLCGTRTLYGNSQHCSFFSPFSVLWVGQVPTVLWEGSCELDGCDWFTTQATLQVWPSDLTLRSATSSLSKFSPLDLPLSECLPWHIFQLKKKQLGRKKIVLLRCLSPLYTISLRQKLWPFPVLSKNGAAWMISVIHQNNHLLLIYNCFPECLL